MAALKKITNRQRVALVISSSLLALCFLVPPWVFTFQSQGISQVQKPAGYSWVFEAPLPEGDSPLFGITLDKTRLFVEVLGVVALGATGFLLVGYRRQE